MQTGEWRERPWVPDKHPNGVGHQEGIVQSPKKFVVVVPIWKTNIRATSAWSPSCVPSPWLPAQSCPPFPKAWSPWGLLGAWPGATSTGTWSCPVLDFTSHCCPLAQGHGTDIYHLITSRCLTSSQPLPNSGHHLGLGNGGSPAWLPQVWGLGCLGGFSLTKGGPAAPCGAVGVIVGVWAQGRAVGVQLALQGERRGEIEVLSAPPCPCAPSRFPVPTGVVRLELTLTMLMGFRERW